MRFRRIALVIFLLPLLASCEGLFAPGNCTLLPCQDGLRVKLAEVPQGAYTLEVLLPDGGSRTFECRQASQCPPVFFHGVAAAEVTLRLTTDAGTRTETVRPVYARQRPNGPRCPPECWQAEVTLRLPE